MGSRGALRAPPAGLGENPPRRARPGMRYPGPWLPAAVVRVWQLGAAACTSLYARARDGGTDGRGAAHCQLAPSQVPLGDALEPGPLEVVRLGAARGSGPLRQYPLEHAPRDPDEAAVFPDLDPELDGLVLGVPVGVFGEGEEQRRLR